MRTNYNIDPECEELDELDESFELERDTDEYEPIDWDE